MGESMCGGSGGGSSAGDIQERNERLEEERQKRIREGASLIDNAFAQFTGRPETTIKGAPFPGFKGDGEGDGLASEEEARRRQEWEAANPDRVLPAIESTFFDDFKKNFLGFYEPQIDKQFANARGDTTAALVDRGILESTAGMRSLTDLQDRDALERTRLSNRALDETNNLRSGIEREKSNLYALNETAADPERIAPLVQGAASSFAAPNAFEPLGSVFGDVLNNVAAYQAARNNAVTPFARPTYQIAGGGGSRNSGGSGRVVG